MAQDMGDLVTDCAAAIVVAYLAANDPGEAGIARLAYEVHRTLGRLADANGEADAAAAGR